MDMTRMGLGTDQLELPTALVQDAAALPPAPRGAQFEAPGRMPSSAEAAALAPWAKHMQLPGVDT